MAEALGTAFVKGMYGKLGRLGLPAVQAPLPPSNQLPYGATPNYMPSYIDPRVAPGPLPATNLQPSLPPLDPRVAAQMNAPIPQTPPDQLLGVSGLNPQATGSPPGPGAGRQQTKADVRPQRKPPGSLQPSTATATSEPISLQLARMVGGGGY